MTVIRKIPAATRHPPNGSSLADAETSIGGLRTYAGRFLAQLYNIWGRPDWFVAETPFADEKLIPDQISVHDYIIMLGNISHFAADPGYFIDYAVAGVPFFRGGVDLGMQSAPNLFAALELIATYADYRPGYHRYSLLNGDGRIGLELVATIDLGPGRPIIVGTPLLVFTRMATRYLGHPASDAVVELQHVAQDYADRFQAALGCEVRYNAPRDAVTFPARLGNSLSMTYDADLWRTANFRCKEEQQQRTYEHLIFDIRTYAATFLAENGRPPRLTEMANQFGVSSRTLVRRLRSENQTYHGLLQVLLRTKSVELLAQSDLTISDISDRLGFADPSSFYRSFRRWYKVTPAEFRARNL